MSSPSKPLLRNLTKYAHGLYRIYDAANSVIYIGISVDPDSRLLNGHAHKAPWADEYDHHDINWYATRNEAQAEETKAISTEHPKYNVLHINSKPRPKPVRITLDLDPATYTELNRWLGTAAVTVNPDHPRLSIAQALRAMIHASIHEEQVTAIVLDLLRQNQSSPT